MGFEITPNNTYIKYLKVNNNKNTTFVNTLQFKKEVNFTNDGHTETSTSILGNAGHGFHKLFYRFRYVTSRFYTRKTIDLSAVTNTTSNKRLPGDINQDWYPVIADWQMWNFVLEESDDDAFGVDVAWHDNKWKVEIGRHLWEHNHTHQRSVQFDVLWISKL